MERSFPFVSYKQTSALFSAESHRSCGRLGRSAPVVSFHSLPATRGLSGESHNRVSQIRTESGFHRNSSAPTIPSLSRDSRERSLAKTAVYRVVAIALLAAISYYYTGNAGEAGLITILFNASGTAAYYGLERLWESVEWGRGRLDGSPIQRSHEPVDPVLSGERAVPLRGSSKTDSEVNSTK